MVTQNQLNVLSDSDGDNKPVKWYNIVPFVTPFLFVYLYNKHLSEIKQLREKHENETNCLQMLLSDARETQAKLSKEKPSIKLKDLLIIVDEEEKEKQNFLDSLNEVKVGIKRVLDIKCSVMNPIKPKTARVELEDNLFQVSDSELHQGLHDIFDYDHHHCGGGFHGNGRLWRVWMQAWSAQAEAKKFRNIVERIHDKLKE